MRTVSLLTASVLIAATLLAKDDARQHVSEQWTQTLSFAPGGTIRIANSVGHVLLEGWDQPMVEITVRKATQKKYAPEESARAQQDLERIQVVTQKDGEGTLVIRTEFPERNLLTRPRRGKTNVQLEYVIRAPKNCHLEIRHDVGGVDVKNFTGNINATNRIGELTVAVPRHALYAVDARTRVGDVSSDLGEEPTAATRTLYARVGIGEIRIHRTASPDPEPHCNHCATDI